MKNITRCSIVTGMLLLSVNQALAFSDVPPSHPASDAVTAFVKLEKIANREHFFPNRPVTKCEFLKMLLAPLPQYSNQELVAIPYPDVPAGSWCAAYIRQGLLANVIVHREGKFLPDSPLTLGDAIGFLYRHYNKVPVINMLVSVKNFTDVDSSESSHMSPHELFQIEQGIIDGVIVPKAPRRLGLRDALSRGEAARMLHEAYGDYEYTRADVADVLFGNASDRTKMTTLAILNSVARDYFNTAELNYDEMLRAAIQAFTAKIPDKHSKYFLADEFEEWMKDNGGNYVGMGVQLSLDGGKISIEKVFPDSPAQAAGVMAGDVIIGVNGQELRSASLDEFFSLFTRAAGEQVTLEITRMGESARLKFTMTLTQLIVPDVTLRILEGNRAYFQIDRFGSNTLAEFRDLYRKNYTTPPAGVIIDLRDNPGGDLSSLVDVASLFVPRVTRVARMTDNKGQATVLKTTRSPLLRDTPVVTLVNGGTASAAEILAAALRDLRNAPVVGNKTVGKGTVQRVYSYPDGSGWKQTIYAWSPPKSPSIDGIGISPDREVSNDPATPADEILQAGLEELQRLEEVRKK